MNEDKIKIKLYKCDVCGEVWEDVEGSKVECCFHDNIKVLAEKTE